MTSEENGAGLQRYLDRFDSAQYSVACERLASNLHTEMDALPVVEGLVLLQNAAYELCGQSGFEGAWHVLAVYCGQHTLSFHTLDAMRAFLIPFNGDDPRIDDFDGTARAIVRAYMALDDLKTAAAHANGIHGWQGRLGYDLLAAVDYLTQAAIQALAHGDQAYLHEKLHSGLTRITYALNEGTRHSDQPEQYDFSHLQFPGHDES